MENSILIVKQCTDSAGKAVNSRFGERLLTKQYPFKMILSQLALLNDEL